jgi:hypothetical protein
MPQQLRVFSLRYLVPFNVLKSYLEFTIVKGDTHVSCSYDRFVLMLRRLIAGVQVDEAWYLERNPDIAEAIKQGIVESVKSHFLHDGYFEGRMPFPVHVDERYYLFENSDLIDYVREGKIKSGQQHFDKDGYREGRLPFEL